ncbi:MAG: hypothetical protein ACK5LP_08450 [Campylobacteraceae bacterium]
MLKSLFVSIDKVKIYEDFIVIESYPFEPSVAYKQTIFKAFEIENVDINYTPSTIKVENDLIFIPAFLREELKTFAQNNKISIIKRELIWDFILEPFLDTEFSEEQKEKTFKYLNGFGLDKNAVQSLRDEVSSQMYKYNFDTMLWEWINLSLFDVLSAMRAKYDKKDFKEFYQKAIRLALLK